MNNITEVGKLDVRNSRFPIRFESPIELADAFDALASHYKRHYESRHDVTVNVQRYDSSRDRLQAEMGLLRAESSKPNIALRVVAKESPDTSFSVEVLSGSLLQDSIDFHRSMWQDCYNRNWWKPEYRGN